MSIPNSPIQKENIWTSTQANAICPFCHIFRGKIFTIFSPAVSASSDLSGQRSVLRQGREGAVGRFGATIVGIFATFVDNNERGRTTKEDEGTTKEEGPFLVGGQDPTDLETQGRPQQRLRPRASRSFNGRSLDQKLDRSFRIKPASYGIPLVFGFQKGIEFD